MDLTFIFQRPVVNWVSITVDSKLYESCNSKGEIIFIIIRETFSS